MGEFDAYRNYEKNKNDGGDVKGDFYGRIDLSSLNNSYDDDSGDFVSNHWNDRENSSFAKQNVKSQPSIHKPPIHTVQRSMSAIDGERVVDIVCILITIVGLVLIAINFNAVLDAIIQVIYPIIEIVIFIALLAVLGFFIWLALRRRFSSRRY